MALKKSFFFFNKTKLNFKICSLSITYSRKYSSDGAADKNNFQNKLTIEDIDLKDKKVLMRVDYNVPIKDGKVSSNQRIVASLPTIKYVLEKNVKSLVLISHMGRPKGQPNKKYSLKPVAPILSELLGKDVRFVEDCCGKEVFELLKTASASSIFLLENLRFYAEEEGKGIDKNGKKFKPSSDKIKEFQSCLSKLGDVYINDAFGTAHRAHSSMLGEGFKERAAGFLMLKELTFFGNALHNPPDPFLAILGGAKVSDKLPLIMSLLNRVNEMIIGGGMAFTFLKELYNVEIAKSLYDKEGAKLVPKIMETAKEKCVLIHLPVDVVTATEICENPSEICIVSTKDGIDSSHMGLDIGPESIKNFSEPIARAKMIIWNGPPGVFEIPAFAEGTKGLMEHVVAATERCATTIIGGGDTASACKKFNAVDKVSHVSTGGGASLELLEGKQLPGVVALSDKK